MSDSWEKMRRAKEEEFFEKQNKDALARLKARTGEKRPSPITGEPMEQLTVMGVILDRCTKSGGVWFDANEIELVIKTARELNNDKLADWVINFFGSLVKKH